MKTVLRVTFSNRHQIVGRVVSAHSQGLNDPHTYVIQTPAGVRLKLVKALSNWLCEDGYGIQQLVKVEER